MVRKAFAALAVALAVFMSGCADNVDTGMGVTVVTGTSTTARSIAPSTTVSSSSESAVTTPDRAADVTQEDAPGPAVTTVAKSVDPEKYLTETGSAYALYRFVSPTRNLACGFSLHTEWREVGCQSFDVPKPAHRGEYDGQCPSVGVTVTISGAHHECFQTTYYFGPPNTLVLEYGETITVADLTCTSRRTGMTCSYGKYGFTLSREEVALW